MEECDSEASAIRSIVVKFAPQNKLVACSIRTRSVQPVCGSRSGGVWRSVVDREIFALPKPLDSLSAMTHGVAQNGHVIV